MFFTQGIDDIITLVYGINLSYIILYYLLAYCFVAVLKIVLNIEPNAFSVEIGPFKAYDQKALPVMVTAGYFGLLLMEVDSLNVFQSPSEEILFVASVILLCSIFLKFAQKSLQTGAVSISAKLKVKAKRKAIPTLEINTTKLKEFSYQYISDFDKKYHQIIVHLLIVILALLMSYSLLGKTQFVLTAVIMIFFIYYVVSQQLFEIFEHLRRLKFNHFTN